MKQLHLITFSYAKQTLAPDSREYQRMLTYSQSKQVARLCVIVFTRKSEGYPDRLAAGDLEVRATNARTKLGMLIKAWLIARTVVRQDQSVTWISSGQDPFEASVPAWLVSWHQGVELHVQIHGDNFRNDLWRQERFLNPVRLWFGRFVLRRARLVRVVSKRIASAVAALGIAEEKIRILPIHSELETFLAVGKQRLKQTANDAETFTFLYVGRLSREKNIPLILRAFAQVALAEPRVRLRIVGTGAQEQLVRATITDLKLSECVTLVPWTQDVATEMQNADAFVLASDHEGYGLVLIEALATGLPVVTTDVGCVGEVVLPEVHALVVPPQAEAAYATALTHMVEMPAASRLQMGVHGYETVRDYALSKEAYVAAWVNSFSANL